MKIILSALIGVFFSTIILSQEEISIHEYDSKRFNGVKLSKLNKDENVEIIPINKDRSQNLTKAVFGFYPDWEYAINAHSNFHFDLISHIAVFDFKLNSNAGFSSPGGWPWTSFINTAHENGVKVIMTVTNFEITNSQVSQILKNPLLRYTFIANVKTTMITHKLDGINIDFEAGHLNVEDRGSVMNSFVKELTDSVHSWDPDLEVSFAAPAVNWGGWELTGLANSCDYLFVMAYDFFGKWSSTTGPTSPLTSNTSLSVTNTIDVQYQTTRIFNPEKLILGVPYYGPHWQTVNSLEGSKVNSFVENIRFRDAQNGFIQNGVNWSNTYTNSWYNFVSGSNNHQVWIDNDSSLSLKYDLAISRNLKGIGMWALGFDGSKNELWDLIEDKFTQVVGVDELSDAPDIFYLSQNYPNPFNPTTIINYTVPKFSNKNGSNVSLKIYNHLGSEVKTLVNIFQRSGNYSAQFNADNLSSGVYFYSLRIESKILTKKMILIK